MIRPRRTQKNKSQSCFCLKPIFALSLFAFASSVLSEQKSETRIETEFQLQSMQDEKGHPIEGWVNQSQALSLILNKSDNTYPKDSEAFSRAPQFQIFIGDHDVTNLFSYERSRLIFNGGFPLPQGENALEVKQFVNNEWHSIGSHTIQVLSAGGFKEAEWQPRLEININSQLDERTSGDSIESDKPTFTDIASSIGLNTNHQSDNFSIQSSFNLLSVSNREQAIQFGTKGNEARKLDLSDYLINITNKNHEVILGHTSYGSNPLLIDNLSRRGIKWRYQNDADLSFSGALLNGTDIVGFDNLTGLADHDEQYVNALGFGVSFFKESRISLRIEGTYLDALKLSDNDFGIGEISSAEKSKGLGFKFITSDQEDRFNGELVVGLSRYTNPQDDSLDFGDALVELTPETALAHNLNLSYQLVKDWQSPWDSPVNITLLANHNKAEPLYQTLTAFVQANVENKMAGAQYQIGEISGSLTTNSSQDNLDNILSILTTRTEAENFSSNIPLQQMMEVDSSESQPNPLLPNLDYSYQSTHQFAINSPDTLISGFNDGSHLPDQLTVSHDLSASWQLEQDSLSLQSSYSDQDNRQIGRENADFVSLQHSLAYNWQQNDSTSWSFSLGRNRQKDLEANKIQYSKTAAVSFNWQSESQLSLSINYGLSLDEDSLDEAENTSTNADIGLVKNLTKGEWWLPADGSISFRINYNDSESIDRVFDQFSRFGTTVAQLGINLSFQ